MSAAVLAGLRGCKAIVTRRSVYFRVEVGCPGDELGLGRGDEIGHVDVSHSMIRRDPPPDRASVAGCIGNHWRSRTIACNKLDFERFFRTHEYAPELRNARLWSAPQKLVQLL